VGYGAMRQADMIRIKSDLMRLLGLLASRPEGYYFNEICRLMGRSRDTVNKLLRKLVEDGLVEKMRYGNKVFYRVKPVIRAYRRNSAIHRFYLDVLQLAFAALENGLVEEAKIMVCRGGILTSAYIVGAMLKLTETLVDNILEKRSVLDESTLLHHLRNLSLYLLSNEYVEGISRLRTFAIVAAYKLVESGQPYLVNELAKLECSQYKEEHFKKALEKLSRFEPEAAQRIKRIEEALILADNKIEAAEAVELIYREYKDDKLLEEPLELRMRFGDL